MLPSLSPGSYSGSSGGGSEGTLAAAEQRARYHWLCATVRSVARRRAAGTSIEARRERRGRESSSGSKRPASAAEQTLGRGGTSSNGMRFATMTAPRSQHLWDRGIRGRGAHRIVYNRGPTRPVQGLRRASGSRAPVPCSHRCHRRSDSASGPCATRTPGPSRTPTQYRHRTVCSLASDRDAQSVARV